MKRILCYVLVIALVGLSLTACTQSSNDGNETREVVDISGNIVTIPVSVERVFMDWAQGTLHMFTLGAIEKVLAVRPAFDGEIFYWARTIYPNFDVVPRNNDPFENIEALLALQPDVVIAINENRMAEFEAVGIPAVLVNFLDYDNFMKSIQIIGDVLGGEYIATARRYNEFFKNNIALVTERLADVSYNDMELVHLVFGRADNALTTQGGDQIEAYWVQLGGGRYAAHDLIGRSITLSVETLLAYDPDVLFVGGHQQAASYSILMNDPILSEMRAVQNGRVYRIPQGIFPWSEMGPEASMQMVWTAKTLFPDRFSDVDLSIMAKGFYRDFLGVEVSDTLILQMQEGRLTSTSD
jgi:iron complex transport system substrate-binding protein